MQDEYFQKYQDLTRRLKTLQLAKATLYPCDLAKILEDHPVENNGYNVYCVDAGATYWIGAPTMMSAIAVLATIAEREAWCDDVDGFEVNTLSEAMASEVMITLDEIGSPQKSAYELAIKLDEPDLVGCSEW